MHHQVTERVCWPAIWSAFQTFMYQSLFKVENILRIELDRLSVKCRYDGTGCDPRDPVTRCLFCSKPGQGLAVTTRPSQLPIFVKVSCYSSTLLWLGRCGYLGSLGSIHRIYIQNRRQSTGLGGHQHIV